MTTLIKQNSMYGIADTALLSDLAEAAKQFADWQDLLIKSNDALYKVMSSALAIGQTYNIEILKVAAKANNIATQRHSTAFGIAAKLVFRGLDSATASTYGTVLEKAHAAGIAPDGLSAWIIENKGIAKIRNEDAIAEAEARKASDKVNVERGKTLADSHYTTSITLPKPSSAVAQIKVPVTTRSAALLVKINDAGDIDVLFSYTDNDVIEMLYRKMGEAMISVVKPSFSQIFAEAPLPLADEQNSAIEAAAAAANTTTSSN